MTFWTLFSYLKTHRLAMAIILVLLIGETGISLLIPYLVGQFTGLLSPDSSPIVIAGMPLSLDLAAEDPCWRIVVGLRDLGGIVDPTNGSALSNRFSHQRYRCTSTHAAKLQSIQSHSSITAGVFCDPAQRCRHCSVK